MAPYFVYVTLSGEDRIAIYAMDRDSGKLDVVDVCRGPRPPGALGASSEPQVPVCSPAQRSGGLLLRGRQRLWSPLSHWRGPARVRPLLSRDRPHGRLPLLGLLRGRRNRSAPHPGRRLPRRRPGGVALNRPGSALDPGGPLEPVRLRPSHRDPVGRERRAQRHPPVHVSTRTRAGSPPYRPRR